MDGLRFEYLRLLEPWVASALRDVYTPGGRPDLRCYGSGYNGWGVQTNQKSLAAFAILATEPELDERRAGASRGEITDLALGMLRFSLESHLVGTHHCADGESWGHTWISALGIERMMHAVDELADVMTEADQQLLRRVLVSECDWLVDEYRRGGEPGQVKAGLVFDNDPESNLWNGALLRRTAMMYPDAPRAAEYLRQGSKFILNGISVEADAGSDELFDGRPLSEWHIDANFFPSYALNHHGYLNLGYMVICLSQVAMIHFAWKKRGLAAPESVYLHVDGLWQLVKMLTFPDGRLARVGGDTRARYCYCQDYAIPTWLLMLDRLGDADCAEFERRWLATVRAEVAAGDGASFLAARLKPMADVSPTYYTRLESDRAAALSMGLCWRRLFDDFATAPRNSRATAVAGEWADQYHGATVSRGARRLASWTWRAAEPPQGLCVPLERGDMAEWRWNLSARLAGVGACNVAVPKANFHALFAGGFVNAGTCEIRSERNLAEGESDKAVATQRIAFAALPDDATVIGIQFATSVNRSFIRSIKGVHLLMPNDIFNGGVRRYHTTGGVLELAGPSSTREVIDIGCPWVNIDDELTLANLDGENLRIFRPGDRQIEIRDKPFSVSSLHADEICQPFFDGGVRSYEHGETIVDTAFSLRVGEAHGEAGKRLEGAGGGYVHGRGFRAAVTGGADGETYLLAFNLEEVATAFEWRPPANSAPALRDAASGETASPNANGSFTIALEPATARLFRLIS